MVSAAEEGVSEMSWLQRHIMNRSAGHYARQVARDVNELHRSMNGQSEWSNLSYYLALSEDGKGVHIQAAPHSANPVLQLGWRETNS